MPDYVNLDESTTWDVETLHDGEGYRVHSVLVEGESMDISDWRLITGDESHLALDRGEGEERVVVTKVGDVWWIHHSGKTMRVEVVERGTSSSVTSEGSLTSPMPGKVLTVMASEGESVSEGQALLILEAMKMEHRICAPRDGVVSSVNFSDGDQVDQGAVLIELEEV